MTAVQCAAATEQPTTVRLEGGGSSGLVSGMTSSTDAEGEIETTLPRLPTGDLLPVLD